MRFVFLLCAIILLMPNLSSGQGATLPNVVTTIRPVHSIAAFIMHGVGEPKLLLGKSQGHHGVLKPSQVQALSNAEILFWIGPEMESFLVKPITTLAAKAHVVGMMKLPDIQLLALNHEMNDPHIWLTHDNALAMARKIGGVLAETDVVNRDLYQANLIKFEKELGSLRMDLVENLKPSASKNALIFHNSLGYFAKSFGFNLHPLSNGHEELGASAKQISQIGKLAKTGKYQCIFYEAGHNAKVIISVADEANFQAVMIDPMGFTIESGPQLYFTLLRNLGDSIEKCFKPRK